ncbi:LTV1 ribosome biogenesis factor [Rhodnius prolixus]
MGKKKKFIDKKNAITFRLVHRSQRDPLITDDKAPQHVLQQIRDERKDELEKYGIYYDDDYDYLQHLKEKSSEVEMIEVPTKIVNKEKKSSGKLALPSSVFASECEEKVGLLNKAAPKSGLQLDLDPDIVAAMDEDFDYSDPENMLDDDFVLLANATPEGSENEEDYTDDDSDVDDDEEEDRFDMEETKSRFTEYSMTSSVIRRNEQLTMLDGRFEEMFSQYDDNEIGALDCEEIEGDLDSKDKMLENIIEQYETTHVKEPLKLEPTVMPDFSESSDSDSENSVVEVKEKEKWDCESILSTYSTLYNHPKLIDAPSSNRIKVSGKTGIPITKEKLTATALAKLDGRSTEGSKNKATGPGSLASAVSYLSIRPKGETPRDRLARKTAFKQHKKERRVERKLNTEAFKEEKKRLEKMMAHNKSKFQVPI